MWLGIFLGLCGIFGIFLLIAEVERRSFKPPAVQPVSDYYANLGRPFLGLFNTWIKLTHPQQPFHSLEDFPQYRIFEENSQAIAAEARKLYDEMGDDILRFHELDVNQQKVSNEKWKTFVLKWYAGMLQTNCKKAPITAQLIQSCPNVKLGMFSILEPRSRIPPHYGPNKACLRFHLPLVVPTNREECWIKVNGQKHIWQQGKGVLFDDTFLHEVSNNTDEVRIVLFLDVVRPMTGVIGYLSRKVLSWSRFIGYVNDINKKAEQPRRTIVTVEAV